VVHELVHERLEQRLQGDRPLLRGGAREDADRAVAPALPVQLEDDPPALALVGTRLVQQIDPLPRDDELLAEVVDEALRAARQRGRLAAAAEAVVAALQLAHQRRRADERAARQRPVEPRAIEAAEEPVGEHPRESLPRAGRRARRPQSRRAARARETVGCRG